MECWRRCKGLPCGEGVGGWSEDHAWDGMADRAPRGAKEVNMLRVMEAGFLAVMEGICKYVKGEMYNKSCMED